jgi:3-methyladenine DNA glycosylase AlkC
VAESQPFKNYFNPALVRELAARVRAVYPAFKAETFVSQVEPQLQALELKGRVSLIAAGLRRHLPDAYPEALGILLRILGPEIPVEAGMFNAGWTLMPIAQFVEDYGLDHVDLSLDAMVTITKRHTAEFAVRPYLERDPERVLARLRVCAHDPNPHVRRWVSEGTRPRLPWGRRLEVFVRDPEPTLALLEDLRDDPEPYVRKSVANHLNDIAKDHPERVLAVAARWLATGGDGTRWVVRHGLRTLIKRGDPAALALLGYDAQAALQVARFALKPKTVRVGQALTIALTLINADAGAHDAVIDLRVHFRRANGASSPKVFKWATRRLAAGDSIALEKSLPMRPVTTRRYHPGRHLVEVQVNGRVLAAATFVLAEPA